MRRSQDNGRRIGKRLRAASRQEAEDREQDVVHFPLETSVGYQVRMVYRDMQRLLQSRIGPHRVTLGMWYYLRALWDEDGLTQRELSRRIGTMEPTTMSAIQSMERSGLVRRVRSRDDRRKLHIHLTKKGRSLEKILIPLAVEVVDASVGGMSADEVRLLLTLLKSIRNNIAASEAGIAMPDEQLERGELRSGQPNPATPTKGRRAVTRQGTR